MPKVMVTIKDPSGAPTIESIAERYGIDRTDFDPSFGVVEVDPRDNLYVALVEERAANTIRSAAQPDSRSAQAKKSTSRGVKGSDQDWEVGGPYSNPRIAPFGPPDADGEAKS